MKKRISSLLIAVLMLATMLPVTAMAEELAAADPAVEQVVSEEVTTEPTEGTDETETPAEPEQSEQTGEETQPPEEDAELPPEEPIEDGIDTLSVDSLSDLDPTQKEMALKGKDEYHAWYIINCTAYSHYMNYYESPYRSVIRQRRNSAYYQANLVAWRTVTFSLSSESKYADKEFGYYEAYLYNLLLDENTENLVGNFASSMESAASNWKTTSEQLGASAWGKLCKSASEFLEDGVTLTKTTPIPIDDAAKEALAKQLCFLSETTKVAKIVSDIETLMGYSKSIFDLVEKIVQVEAVIRVSSDTASVIADMCSASTDSNVPALRYALEEMASFTNGSLTKEQIISCLIGQTSAKELNQFLTKKLQKLIVEKAGTYGLTIEAAQAIGKLTCSSLFNTDKSMENYYKLNALFELETLLKSKVLSYASSFTSNPTAENARKFIAGYTMLYKLFLEGTDGYKEFIKINYRDGGLNSIWSSVSDADYQRIVTSMDNLKFAIRYNLEHEEQEAMADYYDVMRILDAAAVADAGLQPVTPSISAAESQAYLNQVDQESRLHADVIVTDNYVLDADIETYGNIIVTRGSTLNLNGHTLLSHGRMDISGGTVNLNGGTLTVYEDIIQSDGKMYCNKGTLNAAGDYRIQSAAVDDAGNVTYDSSSGILWMTNAADKINVSGDFVTQSHVTTYSSAVNYNWGNVLYAGTLTVKGNFSQLGDYASFIASDAHRVVLNGDGARTVTFEYSKCHFNEVVISTNTTLYWKGDFFVSTLPQDLTIHNGVTISQVGTLDLNGHTLTIKGDLIQAGGTMYCNNGTLNVEGDYRIQEATTDNDGNTVYDYSDGNLRMVNEADRVNVSGDFIMQSCFSNVTTYFSNDFTAGTLTIKGNFSQLYGNGCGGQNFVASGTHKVVLDGNGARTVTFENSNSHFNELVVGTDTRLYWQGDFVINPLLHDLTIYNSVTMSSANTINLNGHTLTIKGDLIQAGGTMYCNNGTLNVEGDYRIQKATTDSDGKVTYGESNGTLRMVNEADQINVSGDFITQSTSSNYSTYFSNDFTAGTLTIKGNFSQFYGTNCGGQNFVASGTHKVVLDGNGVQTVTFESSQSHLNELVVGTDTRLYWRGDFVINPLLHDLTIYNGVTMLSANTINLNGHTLTIKGDLIQSGGEMLCNKGTLNVEGNYRIQEVTSDNDGKITYSESTGKLRMANETDRVNVSGDFVMQSTYGDSMDRNKFSAGTLTVKGNFSQLYGTNCGGQNFVASGTHKVVLDGSDIQTVTFENSQSQFNELILTKPQDTGYTFSRTPCWTKLTQITPGTVMGTVSGGDMSASVTVRILKGNNEIAKTISIDGSYLVSDLPDGVYTMEFSKNGYVTRTCTVEIKDHKPILSFDVELVARGNINGAAVNGDDVEITDVACLYRYLTANDRSQSSIPDEAYFLAVADVNSDGAVDVYDLQLLYETVSGIV